MIVLNITEAWKTDSRVVAENRESTRLILRDDPMGQEVHDEIGDPKTAENRFTTNRLEAKTHVQGRRPAE